MTPTKEPDILTATSEKKTILRNDMGEVRIERIPNRPGLGILPTYKIPDKKKVLLLDSHFENDNHDFVCRFYNTEPAADVEVSVTMNFYRI
jgi:hypothetical protein